MGFAKQASIERGSTMCRVNSFRSGACAALWLLLAPVASHAAAFVSYLEPASPTAPVVIDHNLYSALTLTRPRPVPGVLEDAYIQGFYVDSLHGLPLPPVSSAIVGLFEPGTGQTVFDSWLWVSVQTYDAFHARYVFTEFHTKNALVADVLPGFPGAAYLGGLDADGSVQNLGGIVFPTSRFDIYVQSAPIPEPEAYAMMLAGLGLLGVVARRRRHKAVA